MMHVFQITCTGPPVEEDEIVLNGIVFYVETLDQTIKRGGGIGSEWYDEGSSENIAGALWGILDTDADNDFPDHMLSLQLEGAVLTIRHATTCVEGEGGEGTTFEVVELLGGARQNVRGAGVPGMQQYTPGRGFGR
jgi:hypothetical protein